MRSYLLFPRNTFRFAHDWMTMHGKEIPTTFNEVIRTARNVRCVCESSLYASLPTSEEWFPGMKETVMLLIICKKQSTNLFCVCVCRKNLQFSISLENCTLQVNFSKRKRGKNSSYEEPISKERRNSIKTNVCFCF
jgi:hypothetical protein